MAIGRLKHFLVLGILCSPIFAQLIEGRDVTFSTDDTEPRNDFDIFSICPGNFSTCLNGSNCKPYISRRGRCVACKCPWHYSESDTFVQEKKEVQVGQLKVHIGVMVNNMRSDIMPDLVDLPNEEFPLLVHNITGNMTDDEDRDLPDLISRVGEFARRPIAMPVVVAQRYGGPEPEKDSNNVTAYPGVLHLPFRVNSTKSRPIPAMYFPYCPLGESGGYDGMDGASWGKMTKKNEAMYQLHRLLFAREVTEKIGEIVSSVWPEIANFTIDCDYHYSSTKYPSILTASNMTALLNITKQFTVWSINGTTGLHDILGAVRRLHNPNNTYAKMLVDLVENLTTALDGVDDETKMKNLEFMDESTLYKVVKNTEAIRSLFRNDTMNGGIQKFLNALLVFNKTQETSIMDHNNRMVSKLIIIAKKYSNATNGITPKFDHIVEYLNNMDGEPGGIHNGTIRKFRELIQKLLQAGNDLDENSRRRQIESIVNEGLENAAYSFAGIFYERADETVKDFLNDIYNLHKDGAFTTPSISQKTTPTITHGNMEVENVLFAVMMFSDASSGESRFDLILNYLNESAVAASEHVSTIQNFRIYVQKLSKVGEETTDKEKRQEIERIINDGLAVAVESFATIFDDLPYGKAHTEVQNLLGRLGKTSMQFPPDNQDGTSDDGIFKGSKEEDNIHDRSRRSIGKEGKQVHSHSALNHTSVDHLKNWVYNKTSSEDENPSVAYEDGDNYFDNIMKYLNYSMQRTNETNKKIVENLMNALSEFQTGPGMNMTKLLATIKRYREVQDGLPKDANYTFVTEFIHEVHAYGSKMQHGSYQVHVSTGRNLHCILMELSQHIHNRSFNQLMGGIAKHFCNGTDVEENSKNDSMQHRVNETLKLVKMYNNTLKRNESLRGMLEKWTNAYGNISYYYDVGIIKGILANLTKIYEIREPENRKNEISKFWERMPRIDPNFFVGSNHLSQWRFPHIDNFMKKFSRLIPAPNHGLNVSKRVLCELAKNLTMYANSSESFADVVSDLFRLPRPMPGEDGHKREIEKIGDFIKRFNVNLPENMTHQQFADLVTETGEESEFRYRSYEKFMSNITKLAEYFPYQNKTRIQQCIEKLRRADGYLYGEMTVNATMQSYHQYDCVRNIFDPFIKSDAPFERLKSLKSGIWSGNSNTAVQWESHSASIAGNCARYPISGVIVPRNTTDDTTSTRNISVYFKTRHPHVPDEINNTQTRFHMGLLWINAPENFNGTAFLLGRKIKDNIVTPRPYRPTKNPHEDKWTIMMNDSEHPTPRPYRPTFTPHGKKWTLMMNDSEHPTPRPYRPTFTLHEDKWTAMMNDSEHPTPRPPGFTHHSTMSTEKSIDIPFKKGDSIPEVFAEPDQNGDVNIKQFLGGRKVNQAVKRTSGVWIVKDQTISPAPRKRRQAVRPTYVPELSCDENMPEGFRCLRDLDIISPDAVLRLVSNVAAVGVLSFAPLEDGETAEDAFADTSKVQNLVLTSVGTGSTTDQRMQIGFTKYTYHVMTTEGEEKVWKLKEMLKIKSIDGFTGNFTDLKEIAADSNSMEFATFIARIEDNAQWPMLQMSGYYNDDLVLKYRATPASQWAEKQPMNQTFEFAATGELKLKLEKDFTLGHQIKFQFSAAAFNATLFVHLKKRLILTKPVSYSLPAVPFDLRNYDGFPVSAVVEQLYPDYSPYLWKSITGLAVVSVTKNYRIGVWQFRCSTCKTWQYVSLRLNGVPQPKGRKRRSLEIGKTRRARQASAAGCEKLEQKVLFLSPGTKIRYLPSRSDYFWSKDEANVNTDITLSLYRVYRSEYSTDPSQVNISGQLDTNGWALITGTKESSCVRQEGDDPVYNLTKLLSPEEESFVMERMGCDRGRSSQKVRDACGICGGNGKSCVDCSGTINGTAKEDGCGYCFGGSTGRSPTQKNCKHDCQNKEYVDDCGYCHRKGDKIINIRDCAGQCRGLAAYDDCGACRSFFGRGNLTDASTPTEKIRDECGVCGGDGSSCQGCDGEYDSGKVLDKCGNCLLPTDVNFNQKCENIYYINGFTPSVVVLPMRSISFKIYGYFNNHNTASCSLHPLGSSSSESIKLPESKITRFTYGSRVKMSADTVHEVTTFLKKSGFPEGTTFSRWNVSCMSGSDKATADKPLIVRSLNPWSIASIEPPFAPVGKGSVDVVITGAKFPSNEDLVCAASHQVFATSFTTKTDILSLISLFQTDKLMMVGATVLESSQVQCALPNVTKAAKITLHVLTKRGAESMSASTIGRYVSGGVTFEYRDKRPEVKEARLTNDLEYIQIEFDTDVKFVKFSKIPETFCDNILEGKPTILGSSPQCYLYRSNSLLIRPGRNPTSPTARTATIGTITLREGAVVGRDSGGATELFQETTVNIQAPKDPLTPAVELWGKPSYEPCEDVFLGVRTRGVGTWDFDYKWSVEIQEKPKLNDEEDIVEYLQKETTGLSWKLISFNNYKGSLQLGANYTIRVSVENDFGKTSENKTIRFMIKEHWSGLQLDLYPPRTGIVESTKTFSIKARAMFLKPRCADDTDSEYNILNANSVNKMDIKYSWKAEKLNSTGVKLANDDKSTLRVKKDTLTPGRYKFTVTASLSESGVENKSASMSSIIEVKGGPLLAHISGPKARVVQSDQIMTLDGSKSRDPNGGNLTYTWKCEKLATGSPCKIFPQENENSNSSATWKSADTIFSSNQTGGVLNFPADRFEPRLLANITLIVQSGDRTASKSVQIQIQDASDLPSIQIIQRNEFGYEAFPVGNKLRVPAAIIGNGNKTWTMILTWKCLEEEGFAYVDLETVNATRLQAVKEVANDRRPAVFSLVLKRNALLPSSTYKFQIRAQADPEVHTQEDGNTKSIYAEIEVKTAPLPTGGELIVSPTNGTVLKTKFKLKAEKWNVADDGQELKYRFAYKSTRKGQNERMSFLGAYSSLQEIETYLPAGPEMKEYLLPIVVMIRIGENDINVQQKTINVLVRPVKTEGADTEIDDTILEDMTTEAAEALVSGDQEYAVSKILLVGKSVKSNEKKKEMRNLADAAIKKYKTYIPTTTRDASSQLSGVVDLLSTFSGDVEVAQESKKIAIDMSENSLNLMRGRTLSSRRRREVEEDTTEDFDPELFNIILALYDVLLQIPENNKTLIAERKENFKRHTELIMEEYCIAVQYGETLQTVESVLSEIGVQKVEMEYDGVYGKSQIFELANDIEMQYSNWDCDPTSTELCPGACISFGSYRGDVMHSYGTQPGTQLKRITPVAAFFIRNPSDGLDASSEANTTDIAGMLTIKFNVTTSQEKMVQCRVLNAASLWTNETCRTVITGTEVTCECNEVSGYFAVFSTPDVEVSTTNSMMPPSETDPLITTLKMESVPPIWESNCAEPNIFSKNCNKTCAAIKCPMNRKGYCKLCHCECVCPYVVEGKCTFEPGEEDERNDTGMTTAAIVGLTIGLVVLSLALVAMVYMYVKKATDRRVSPNASLVEVDPPNPPSYEVTEFAKKEVSDEEVDEEAGTSTKKENEYTAEPLIPNTVVDEPPPGYTEKPEDVVIEV